MDNKSRSPKRGNDCLLSSRGYLRPVSSIFNCLNPRWMVQTSILNVTVAQWEGVVTDNFGGQAAVFVRVRGAICHESSISKLAPYYEFFSS